MLQTFQVLNSVPLSFYFYFLRSDAFNLVRQAVTSDLPYGDVKLAMENLDNYYHPKTVATAQVLIHQFDALKLKDKQDPGKFITELENLRMRIASIDKTKAIDDSRLIGHILNNLPSAYDQTVSMIEFKMDESPDSVTVGYVQSQLSLRHQRLYGFKLGFSSESDGQSTTPKSDEQALYAGGFRGQCRKCGKYGHRAAKPRIVMRLQPLIPRIQVIQLRVLWLLLIRQRVNHVDPPIMLWYFRNVTSVLCSVISVLAVVLFRSVVTSPLVWVAVKVPM